MYEKKLELLAAEIGKVPQRDWCGPYDPAIGEDAPLFYMFCLAQQCGTGLTTENDTLTCSNLWDLYRNNWQGKRDIFCKVSFEFFSCFLLPPDATWRVSPARLLMRYYLHNDIANAYNGLDTDLDTIPALATDPYKKRLNLIKNALRSRPERFLPEEGGPVIDYHVMRVILRYFGIELTGDDLLDEASVRKAAWEVASDLYAKHNLTHDQIDCFLWLLGRNTCCYGVAKCNKCPLIGRCARILANEPRIETFFY